MALSLIDALEKLHDGEEIWDWKTAEFLVTTSLRGPDAQPEKVLAEVAQALVERAQGQETNRTFSWILVGCFALGEANPNAISRGVLWNFAVKATPVCLEWVESAFLERLCEKLAGSLERHDDDEALLTLLEASADVIAPENDGPANPNCGKRFACYGVPHLVTSLAKCTASDEESERGLRWRACFKRIVDGSAEMLRCCKMQGLTSDLLRSLLPGLLRSAPTEFPVAGALLNGCEALLSSEEYAERRRGIGSLAGLIPDILARYSDPGLELDLVSGNHSCVVHAVAEALASENAEDRKCARFILSQVLKAQGDDDPGLSGLLSLSEGAEEFSSARMNASWSCVDQAFFSDRVPSELLLAALGRQLSHVNPSVRKESLHRFLALDWDGKPQRAARIDAQFILSHLVPAADSERSVPNICESGHYTSYAPDGFGGVIANAAAQWEKAGAAHCHERLCALAQSVPVKGVTPHGSFVAVTCLERASTNASRVETEGDARKLLGALSDAMKTVSSGWSETFREALVDKVFDVALRLVPVEYAGMDAVANFLVNTKWDFISVDGPLHGKVSKWVSPAEARLSDELSEWVASFLDGYGGDDESPGPNERKKAWEREGYRLALMWSLVTRNQAVVRLVIESLESLHARRYQPWWKGTKALILAKQLLCQTRGSRRGLTADRSDWAVNGISEERGLAERGAELVASTLSDVARFAGMSLQSRASGEWEEVGSEQRMEAAMQMIEEASRHKHRADSGSKTLADAPWQRVETTLWGFFLANSSRSTIGDWTDDSGKLDGSHYATIFSKCCGSCARCLQLLRSEMPPRTREGIEVCLQLLCESLAASQSSRSVLWYGISRILLIFSDVPLSAQTMSSLIHHVEVCLHHHRDNADQQSLPGILRTANVIVDALSRDEQLLQTILRQSQNDLVERIVRPAWRVTSRKRRLKNLPSIAVGLALCLKPALLDQADGETGHGAYKQLLAEMVDYADSTGRLGELFASAFYDRLLEKPRRIHFYKEQIVSLVTGNSKKRDEEIATDIFDPMGVEDLRSLGGWDSERCWSQAAVKLKRTKLYRPALSLAFSDALLQSAAACEFAKSAADDLFSSLLQAATTTLKASSGGYNHGTEEHMRKLRLWRFIASLSRVYKLKPERAKADWEAYQEVLSSPEHTDVKQCIERAALSAFYADPQLHFDCCKALMDMNMRPGLAAGYVSIAATAPIALPQLYCVEAAVKALDAILPWATTHTHVVRSLAQIALVDLAETFPAAAEELSGLQAVLRMLHLNEEYQGLRKSVSGVPQEHPLRLCCSERLMGSALCNEGGMVGLTSEENAGERTLTEEVSERLSLLRGCIAFSSSLTSFPTPCRQINDFLVAKRKLMRERRSAESIAMAPSLGDSWLEQGHDMVQTKGEAVGMDEHGGREAGITLATGESPSSPKVTSSSGIIVVTSLCTKDNNLGGVCRTCEVLGAKKVCFPDSSCVRSADFQALSKGSEHLVPWDVVPRDALVSYLARVREEGYVSIAVEQTTHSASLWEFDFPPKCALVLGGEREGIPPDVLKYVDRAVFIPQRGQVSSLNVHVSAALVINAHAAQHLGDH